MLDSNFPSLTSRAGDAQVSLMKLSTSFNLIDAAPAAANAFSKLAYYNAAAFGNTGGVNNFTFIAVVRPSFTTYPGNLTSLLGYMKGGTTEQVYAVPLTGDVDSVDSYGIDRGILSSASAAVVPNKTLMKNTVQERWTFIAFSCSNVALKLFVDGNVIDNAYTGVQNDGIRKISFPAYIASGASGVNDWDAGGGFWPQMRFALGMLYTRTLTNQELYDLYGMIMYGRGYAINRQSLGGYWIGRRDSTVIGDITTLPGYIAFDTPRTVIPDLSGAGRNLNFYSNKAAWSAVLGGTDTNPGIYIPRVWIDNNNLGTSKFLTLNSTGSTIS